MKSHWSLLLVLLSPLWFSGCGPNSRYYFKQNVELSANLKGNNAKYLDVSIGTPTQPFDQNIDQYGDITIELGNGVAIPFAELSVKDLENVSIKTKELDDWELNHGWPQGSKKLTIPNRIFVIVNGDRILHLNTNAVGLRTNEKATRFGRKDSETLYSMPLSHEQVLILFGEPDKLNDIWKN